MPRTLPVTRNPRPLAPGCGLAARIALALGLPAAAASAQPISLDAFGLFVTDQSRPSFTVLGAGARAAGMGGAFTALADDASAASFNPAGLALLLRPEASLVGGHRQRSDDHSAFSVFEDGELENYSASTSRFETLDLTFASFTLPVQARRRNLCFQISYHRLIDFAADDRRRLTEATAAGESGTIDQTIDQGGGVDTFSVAAAYQITDRLSAGLTLSRWQGDWDFTTRTSESGSGEPAERSVRFAQRSRWRGQNLTAGFLLRYRYLNVGGAWRSSFRGGFRVDSRLDADFANPFEPSSRLRADLVWPDSWTLGVAVKPLETLVVTADLAQYDWDDMVIEGLGEEPVNFFDLQPSSRSRTRDASPVRFGTEYTFFWRGSTLAVRAGYFREPRPQLLAPANEANSIRGRSLGVGWKRGRLSVDLALQLRGTKSRILQFVDPDAVIGGDLTSSPSANVTSRERRLFVALLYQFESSRSLRRLFHFLFVGPLDRPPKTP